MEAGVGAILYKPLQEVVGALVGTFSPSWVLNRWASARAHELACGTQTGFWLSQLFS